MSYTDVRPGDRVRLVRREQEFLTGRTIEIVERGTVLHTSDMLVTVRWDEPTPTPSLQEKRKLTIYPGHHP